MTTKAFEDKPFFFCDSILHEARNIFGLEGHCTPESVSPSGSSGSSEGGSESLSRYFDDTAPPDMLPATVCMRDLDYGCLNASDDDDQGLSLIMEELADEMLYLHQMDENPYVQS